MDRAKNVRRSGFTLVEVLVSAVVLVIALIGILEFAAGLVRIAAKPGDQEQAVALAEERLDYFRAQPNPYMAVGGTYYLPPLLRYDPDFNTLRDGSNVNISSNGQPSMFVREYLYDFQSHRYLGGNGDIGQTGQTGRADTGVASTQNGATPYGENEIPPTPIQVDYPAGTKVNICGVVPNLNDAPADVAYDTSGTNGLYGGRQEVNGQKFYFVRAPRANDTIGRPTAPNNVLPVNIKFVREVWFETNNPGMPGGVPLMPSFSIAGLGPNAATVGPCPAYAAAPYCPTGCQLPPAQNFLPPFVIAVTVRVFLRDNATQNYQNLGYAAGAEPARSGAPAAGPGYDRSKPLAETVGFFGLRRF